ncbi:MAG: DUF6174 domain-containing protein [Pirellulaceae bacterium]|nr:hypothetical protein [Planctomycetales bacterium]
MSRSPEEDALTYSVCQGRGLAFCQSFTRWRLCVLGLTAWLAIAACTSPTLALTQAELDAKRDLWNTSGSMDYDYVLQRSCFCHPDFIQPGLVEIRAGMITAVTDADTLQPLDPELFLTVDGLFAELQRAIDYPAFDIQAQFDSNLGYPTSFFVDYVLEIADEEMSYRAHDLVLSAIPGDANLDRVVDDTDFEIWNGNKFSAGTNWRHGDFTGDGVTDVLDFNVWNAHRVSQSSQTASVPEPTSCWLATLGLMFCIARKRINGFAR